MEAANPCCKPWIQKTIKFNKRVDCLREAVAIIEERAGKDAAVIKNLKAEKLHLEKALDEVKAQADEVQTQVDFEREQKYKELTLRISLENEISDLKSEISSLKQKANSGIQNGNEEVRLLQARISEWETEVNRLNGIVEEEKIRADSERKNAETEKKKAAEAGKLVEEERNRTNEAKGHVDIEAKMVMELRLQLERSENEAAARRVSLENEISDLKSEISSLKQKASSGIQNGNEEVRLLQACISKWEAEVNRLNGIVEEEKIRADSERKNAEAEKKKAAEAGRLVEEERNRTEEAKGHADIEAKKVMEFRLQLERSENEAAARRVSLENEISDLKSEILCLKESENSRAQSENNEVRILQACVSEGETEIIELRGRVEQEQIRADSERKNAEAEKKKSAKASKLVKEERCRIKEAMAHADIEAKKVMELKLQLERSENEAAALRLSLENEISDLKSEILFLKQNGSSRAQSEDNEVKLLQARVSEGEAEINHLKGLVEQEKIRADSERKNAEAEKKKSAEASKLVKKERCRTEEVKGHADIEAKKVMELRLQLERSKNEAAALRVSLENEISDLKSEILFLKQNVSSRVQSEDNEVRLLQARVSDGETEINQLKVLVEQEKLRADSERKNVEAEKKKASEAYRLVKEEKSRSEDLKRLTDIEAKKATEFRLQLEKLTNEADEANKKLEVEKQKAIKENQCAESEKAKTEEKRKLAKAYKKKTMEEKSRADHLSGQLEEDRRKIEELQKELQELLSSKKLAESHVVSADNNLNSRIAKLEDSLRSETAKREAAQEKLVVEFLKFEDATKRLEAEKEVVVREKKRADLEMAKAEEQRKLAEEIRKKVVEEKSRADQLSQQLEEGRQRIEELQKEIGELLSSRNLAVSSPVPSAKVTNAEKEKMKLLKKKLKFEKTRLKHAEQVAKLEQVRNNILQQEVGCLTQEFVRFSRRLDLLNGCFSDDIEGTNELEKTEDLSNMQRLNLKRKLSAMEPFLMYPQSEHELVKPTCTAMDTSRLLKKRQKCTARFLPASEGNCTKSISGIDSKLESLLGGSNRKMLQSSISSTRASFSDSQMVGSQERGAFSVTRSAKLVEDNLNLQTIISRLSDEVTKIRNNENLAVAAENSVRSPLNSDGVGRVSMNSRKRKRILNAFKSIENLCSEDKKLHLQIEEKLSLFSCMLNRHTDKSFKEGRCFVPNLQGDSRANHDGSHKKRKTSHKQKLVNQQSCGGDGQSKVDRHEMKGSEEAKFCRQANLHANNLKGSAQACGDVCNSVMSDRETLFNFEEVANGDYMRLLDLDNPVEEECYRVAREMPLSPTLLEIESQIGEAFGVDKSKLLVEDGFYEGLSGENLATSCSFDIIDVEINSNKLKSISGNSGNSLYHKDKCPINLFENLEVCDNQIRGSDAEVEISHTPISPNDGAEFRSESELKSQQEKIPEYFVVFSDIKDSDSICRIFHATKSCLARCSSASHADWVVQKVLHAITVEDLLPKEKVCVFFSLLLYNFSGPALRNLRNLTRNSIPCLDSFAEHMRAVMSDVETRSMFAESICLDDLCNLIEDFLIYGTILVYNDISSETPNITDSRINVLLDGVNITLSSETASTEQLVAGSIIFASMCVAVDKIGVICDASYNIFRMQKLNSSLMPTILHVFAYLCGKEYFTLGNYGLIMTVIKSLVTYLERGNLSLPATCVPFSCKVWSDFLPCSTCPFSEDALSVDSAISLLLKVLQNYARSDTIPQDQMESVSSLNSVVISDSEKAENSGDEEARGVFAMNVDTSCCLNKYGIPAAQPDFVSSRSICHFIDVLSLVELVACKMSWEWSCNKIVSQLLNVLGLCVPENFSAAIVILLGKLGRLGVDACGYEDKEVENLRCRLSAFLCQNSTLKLGLPTQITTINALVELLPLGFEDIILNNAKLPIASNQSVTTELIRKWFSLLSTEQQSLSFNLLQPVGVNSN